MAKKYTGISKGYLKKQAEQRARLRARHERERKAAKSYGKRGAAAESARARIEERQRREMKELAARQAAEREQTRSRYRLREAKATSWQSLRNQYAQGNVAEDDFKPENLRYALLNHNGLRGEERKLFERAVRNMTGEDLKNLGKMYSNVLEVWRDSEDYFESVSEEVVKRISGMARQTAANISKMLRQGNSELDDKTVELAMEGWNFKLKTKEQTLRKMGLMK